MKRTPGKRSSTPQGIPATPWLSGLGENPAVRAMFVAHLQQALNTAMEEAA